MPKNRGTYRTASLSSNAEPRSRPKRTTSGTKKSTSQDLQYLENSTTTATLDVVPDDDDNTIALPPKTKQVRTTTKKVTAISPIIHTESHDDNDSTATTNIDLKSTTTPPPPPTHWVVDTDQVVYQEISVPVLDAANVFLSSPATTARNKDTNVFHTNTTTTNNVPSVFHCTIRGNPLPLRRHRTRRGFIYNPSAATQLTFRNLVLHIIDSFAQHDRNCTTTAATSTLSTNEGMSRAGAIPLWDIDQPIAVSIVFRMKRPNLHFIGNKPFIDSKSKKNVTAASRLRDTAPKVTCTTSMRTDIDNLAKFVLDSLNNVTYADDKQIVSLHVIKLFDNDVTNRYQGSTTITIRLLHDDDMTTHLIEQQQQILSTTSRSETQNNNMF